MDHTPRRLTDEADTKPGAHDGELDDESARRAREIRSEIEQTREDMSETIEAIQEKLRPGNIAAAATDRVKTATTTAVRNMADTAGEKVQDAMESTRRVTGNLADSGRANTLAGAMIGIGSAWLLVDRWRHSGERGRWRNRRGEYYREGRTGEPWYRDEEDVASEAHDETGVIERSYLSATSMSHEAGEQLRRTSRRARNRFAELLESNPLMVGAAALAVGAAVGLALPETERENEWLGEARETLAERAQEMASQARQAAGDIAGQVASEVVSGENKSE
jgi:hypothetical protein